jgi:hypothetical protein
MSDETKQRPVETLRDGSIKASIWKNEGEKGTFFAVTFARTYEDKDGKLQDTNSFSGVELLRLARLADKAYDRAAKLTRAARVTDETEEEEAA